MSSTPIICLGQQPCGFFPRRFLFAKLVTARRLQAELGGEIVFFYHDSDHDPRETRTTLRHRKSGERLHLNFTFENKLQRKFSPLYLKRVSKEWRERTSLQLPAFVEARWVDAFRSTTASTVGEFCLEMYRRMGLLDGIRVMRSSDPAFRLAACEVPDFFVDVPFEDETVRARLVGNQFQLHRGGESYFTFPLTPFSRAQVSPARDTRLVWMQSVVRCTHYVAGAGERMYLDAESTPEITFVDRDTIDDSHEAYTDVPA